MTILLTFQIPDDFNTEDFKVYGRTAYSIKPEKGKRLQQGMPGVQTD